MPSCIAGPSKLADVSRGNEPVEGFEMSRFASRFTIAFGSKQCGISHRIASSCWLPGLNQGENAPGGILL